MTWSLNLSGPVQDCYGQLDEKVKNTKEGRTKIEQEHIDAAADLFRRLVPNDIRLRCDFMCAGHTYANVDVSFNSSCSVSLK